LGFDGDRTIVGQQQRVAVRRRLRDGVGPDKVIATLMEAGLRPKDASTSTAAYIVDDYLRDAQRS
jgi:hypothetical protein